ncbi:MAG: type II toxin-antitoxin system RelE/ParE family toxin [Verrucomicrobiaceae bacterium]|nr:MAG: type II toxin-antitoxin system RelE/ParE family toxin [Verrucomicrobiaceae bacterium]
MTWGFLSPALSEIAEAAEYYEGRVRGLGGDFVDEVDAAISRIRQFPDAWGSLSENYRHCSLRRFPFAIIYTRDGAGEILVVSIFHKSREPLSWKRNL